MYILCVLCLVSQFSLIPVIQSTREREEGKKLIMAFCFYTYKKTK